SAHPQRWASRRNHGSPPIPLRPGHLPFRNDLRRCWQRRTDLWRERTNLRTGSERLTGVANDRRSTESGWSSKTAECSVISAGRSASVWLSGSGRMEAFMTKLLSTTAMLLALTVTSASAQGIYMGRDGRVHSSGIAPAPESNEQRAIREYNEAKRNYQELPPVTSGEGCGGFGVVILAAVERGAKNSRGPIVETAIVQQAESSVPAKETANFPWGAKDIPNVDKRNHERARDYFIPGGKGLSQALKSMEPTKFQECFPEFSKKIEERNALLEKRKQEQEEGKRCCYPT